VLRVLIEMMLLFTDVQEVDAVIIRGGNDNGGFAWE
jgi:hypothetical protein